jgi:hypothetical protein
MELEDKMFWTNLRSIASDNSLQPFMRAYQNLCLYFKNGTPLGRMFEYYQMISRITLEFNEFKRDEIQKLRDHLLQDSGKTNQSKSWLFRERTEIEIEERLLVYKVNLFLNYAAELDQFKLLRKSGSFKINNRAKKSQISKIG